MSKHATATAHGRNVIGTVNTSTNTSACNNWINWNTDLKEQVSQVASTHDGSVVAASTTEGSVSILRGVDGGTLMTKSISSNDDTGE